MKTSYKYLAIAFATLLCSCNEELTPGIIDSQVQISAKITPCVLTRVTEDGASFTNGDAIKVQNMDRENKNLATYTYSESTGKWSTSDELYWDGETANTFKAWYPATAAYGSFTIPTDQTSGIAAADWMTASNTAKKADGTVNLSFNHNLAKVTVTIESWSNEYSANEKVANSLELRSLYSVMSNDGNLSGDNVAKWVKTYVAQVNTSFVAIIAPGTYESANDIMQVYVNGSSTPLAVKTSSALTIESGKAYSFKLTIGKDIADITSSVTIGAWDDVILNDQQLVIIDPSVVNLSEEGTANSYIVSSAGSYKFSTVKGNSSESVGAVASAEVLWESFGTDITPNVGDLIKNASYADGAIRFETADTFKEGNAVIAAKDASGTILWSWHIWLTDEPEGQEYYNNAGTMMDRNLGATSATPGDVGALGLLYQWGRKDPFLGSSSISDAVEAKSTLTWLSVVESDSSNGTIEYAIAHPTTFISYNDSNYDWYYTGDSSTDNTRWTESDKAKSIYDPCPAGWRVPDGGEDGIWSTALSNSSAFSDSVLYDSTNEGINFSNRFGLASTIWYPASGRRDNNDEGLSTVGNLGNYWSASPNDFYAYGLHFSYRGNVYPSVDTGRWPGQSVRCVQDVSSGDVPGEDEEELIIPVSYINLDNTYLEHYIGDVNQLTATVGPKDATNKTVVWSSDNSAVVTVDQTGFVRAISKGSATIYAVAGDKMASCSITVKSPAVATIDYIDEYGVNHGKGTAIGMAVWAPVNCGYHETNYQWGKLYQWGRKYGQGYEGDLYDYNLNLIGNVSDATTPVLSEGGVSLMGGSHTSNSNVFYYGNSDWLDMSDDTLWNSGTESSPIKTQYDPCPSGWRVPTKTELNELGKNHTLWQNNDLNQSGYWFCGTSLYTETVTQIFLPAAGFRHNYNGNAYGRGYDGHYWSSTSYPNESYSGCLLFTTGDGSRANGNSVRCVQE